MGIYDDRHIVHENDEDIVRKNEHIDMNGKSISNLPFNCNNGTQNLPHPVTNKCLLSYIYESLSVTLL